MRLLVDRLPSPLGTNFVVWDEAHFVRALDFGDYETRLHGLLHRYYGEVDLIPDKLPGEISEKLDAYFGGDITAIDSIPVKPAGTAFQLAAWSALRRIPAGTTLTYGQQALKLGQPRASRAVGAANGKNPIAIIVPCHRVIGASGALTGYAGGTERKRWLLDHERRHYG